MVSVVVSRTEQALRSERNVELYAAGFVPMSGLVLQLDATRDCSVKTAHACDEHLVVFEHTRKALSFGQNRYEFHLSFVPLSEQRPWLTI